VLRLEDLRLVDVEPFEVVGGLDDPGLGGDLEVQRL
jgi:hypothetical protein